MRPSNILLFRDQTEIPVDIDYPKTERLVSGNPKRETQNIFTNDSGEVFSGIWSSEPGAWYIEMGESEDEYFYVLSGSGMLIDEQDHQSHFSTGDAVIIPARFKGQFVVTEAMSKHYVIIERKTATS